MAITYCPEHDFEAGTTSEGTPRCPACRVALGIPLGARPRKRRRRAPLVELVELDARQLAAGERDDDEQPTLDVDVPRVRIVKAPPARMARWHDGRAS